MTERDIPAMFFQWDGDAMVPARSYVGLANKHYVVGEFYRLQPHLERSRRSEKHYHASIREAWKTLPDDLERRFPSPEHLRKWALCMAGYCDIAEVACSDATQAQLFAMTARKLDPYAVIKLGEDSVRIMTAHSQAQQDKATFQQCKVAVLHQIDLLLGVDRGTTSKQRESA